MSGHPLDNFKFEIQYYGITKLGEFNEIKEAVTLQVNPNKQYRLAGLVVDAQHRVTKTGRQFGSFTIEDYTGKSELLLWADDYTRYSNYLEKGKNLFITGSFRQRYNRPDFEFKVEKIILLESIKQNLTRQLIVDIEARFLNDELIGFIEGNVKRHPGRSGLKFNISEPKTNYKISMYTIENGFEMNDEMAAFLLEKPELEIQVVTM